MGNRVDDYLALVNSDHHILADYSQTSLVRDIVTELDIDVLIPGCTDQSLKTVASLTDKIDMSLDESAVNYCLDKGLLYRFFDQIGLTFPRKYMPGDNVSHVIVKPVDSFSGRGITVVNPRDEKAFLTAKSMATEHSVSGKITVDHYIDGTLISFSTIMGPKGITLLSFVEEHCVRNRFKVDHSFCRSLSELESHDGLNSDLEKIYSHLQLHKNVFLHFQAIKTSDKIYIIEMMMRHPGDLYSSLVQKSFGVDYASCYVDTFLTSQIKHPGVSINVNIEPILRQTLNDDKILSAFKVDCRNKSSIEVLPMKRVGMDAGNNERFAIVFHQFDKLEYLKEFIGNILNEK